MREQEQEQGNEKVGTRVHQWECSESSSENAVTRVQQWEGSGTSMT